jgi:DNA-binding MarR family transcriptional regulator
MRPLDNPIAFTVLNEVRSIEQLAQLRLGRVLPKGLTTSQFAVLNHFSRLGGEKSPAQLARVFQVTKAAMTNTLSRLETQGLVRIRPDKHDGRKKLVSLTHKGHEIRVRAADAAAPVMNQVTQDFGQDRLRQMLPLLRDLRIFLSES